MRAGLRVGVWWWVLVGSVVGFAARSDDHHMYKYDPLRSGFSAEALAPPLALQWKYVTQPDLRNRTTVSVHGNRVFYCSDQKVHAIDAETGSKVWDYDTQSDLRTTPAYQDGRLYVGADSGSLYVLDVDSGKLEWKFDVGDPIRSDPTLVDGVLFFASSRQLFAVDARSQQEIWSVPVSFYLQSPIVFDISQPLIYFASVEGSIYSYDYLRQALLWKLPIGRLTSPPVPAGRYLVTCGEQYIMGLRPRTGRVAWRVPMEGFAASAPTLAHGRIFVGSTAGTVYCVDPEEGVLLWEQPTGFQIQAPPIVAGDTVYVGAIQSYLFAFTIDGKPIWRYKLNPQVSSGSDRRDVNILAPPVVANGALYVVADDGTVYAFRADAFDISPPLISNFRLIIPASNNQPVFAEDDNVRELGREERRRGSEEEQEELKPIAGVPPIEVEAIITDEGSGLALEKRTVMVETPTGLQSEELMVEKVQVLLDGEPVAFTFNPKESRLTASLYVPSRRREVAPLSDGKHTVSITAEDWRGNQVTVAWEFLVDRSTPRPEPPQPQQQPGVPGLGGPGGQMGGYPGGMSGPGGMGMPGGFPGGRSGMGER